MGALAGLRLTRRGVAVLVCAVALLALGGWASYPGLVGLGVALALALLAALVGVAVPVPVSVRRTVRPLRVPRLADCSATIVVRNTSTWLPVTAAGHDRVGGEELPFDLPRLVPGATETTDLPIPTQRRGEISFGPLTLHRFALADLAEVRQTYGDTTTVLVEPRVLDALGLPAGTRRGQVGADERIAHGGTDLTGLREYLPGDDLRRLHWATSARRGTLMVREDADPSAPHLTVVLDDRADSYDGDGFEEAVDVAASLVATAAESRSPSRVVTTSGSLDVATAVPATAVVGIDPELLGRLSRTEPTTGPGTGAHLLSGAPDILVVISGARAALAPLLSDAAAAPVGVVAVVDPAPEQLVGASRGVTVLRGPRAEDLVHAWRSAVAR
ncbi:DUF58 domain-containing protein [Actinotalea caeni]|uniref:DUF58 domain-containing protein n=1 Tax=Actinotalea caeni TaxID=1348467 RepID=UPI0019587F6A|nr:DUF58 domain-containing protein [Actinotalea caeni]